MRVLVLGAAGFAGRYLSRELAARGHDVVGATRTGGRDEAPPPRADGVLRPDDLPAIPLERCDVTARDEVAACLARVEPDAVFFLAGVAAPSAAATDPERAFHVHALGVVHLLTALAARARTARALVVTSSEVYGRSAAAGRALDEDSPLRPEGIYGASKAAGDLAAVALGKSLGLDVIRLRPFNHSGPGQALGFVCPDFAAQVATAVRGQGSGRLEVGNLDVERDFSDVRDVVRGYALALERGRSGEAYNLCSGRPTAVRAILEDLCDLAAIRSEVRQPAARARASEIPSVFGSFDKARAELGWEPAIALRQTLADVLARALEG